MNRAQSNEPDQLVSSTVSITVLSVTPARAKKLFAFASVEIDIDGVQIGVHGIRAMREDGGTAIELPKFRDGGLMLAYAGGGAGLFSAIIDGWVGGSRGSIPVTREVVP